MEAYYKRSNSFQNQILQVTARKSTVRYKQNFLHNHGGAELEQMPSFAISIPGDIKNLNKSHQPNVIVPIWERIGVHVNP